MMQKELRIKKGFQVGIQSDEPTLAIFPASFSQVDQKIIFEDVEDLERFLIDAVTAYRKISGLV